MKIAIIDDSQECLYALQEELYKLYPLANIVSFSNVEKELYNIEFDIVFLDIMLYNQQSFKYGEKIQSIFPKTIIVYISNLEHLVFESFQYNTFFFIRKSSLKKDLFNFNIKYENIQKRRNNFINIRYNNQDIEILQHEIMYIQSQRNKIDIYTTSLHYKSYTTIKKIKSSLDDTCFFQFNSSIILNFHYVKDVKKDKIIMFNNVELYFTRGSKEIFMQKFKEFRSSQIWNG